MVERDWQADWERCEKATPGPWVHDTEGFIYSGGKGPAIARVLGLGLFDERADDLEFITEAREALPYWLERARELESNVIELEADVGDLIETKKQLEAENHRLKAVAEAARELRSAINDLLETPTTCYYAIHLACPVCGRPRQVWDGCNSAYREKSQGKCEYGGDPCVWAEAVIRVEKALAVLEEGGKQL